MIILPALDRFPEMPDQDAVATWKRHRAGQSAYRTHQTDPDRPDLTEQNQQVWQKRMACRLAWISAGIWTIIVLSVITGLTAATEIWLG